MINQQRSTDKYHIHMNSEKIICPCCGKLVPADNIEISFLRPDDIAAMNVDEREARCRYNDDLYVLDEARYFVRCTIPLPILESSRHYSIGAWAEIDKSSFEKIYGRWEDEDQANEPPMQGKLANQVPLTVGSEGCLVHVQLTGPTTRPEMVILDKACSLYAEQTSGITIHRADEYSSLVRP